jgi:uncharacterized protein YdhG (YjbR/CyaY superfamily)
MKPARSRTASRTPASIDAYLETLDDERRATLERLRRQIHAVVPGAVECFSYRMPAFRVDGHVVAGFQATARGGSYYPFSGSTLDALGDAVAGFSRTKSALHFDAGRPPSAALVHKLVRARLAEARRDSPGRSRSTARRGRRTPRARSSTG